MLVSASAQGIQDAVLTGPFLVAFLLAVAAGVVSFLSPCCLPLVPGYLSYVAGLSGAEVSQSRRRGRTVLGTALFVAGFAAVFASYGAIFGAMGGLLIDYQGTLIRILGVFTIVLGLIFAGVLARIPILSRTVRFSYKPSIGLSGAPVLGVMFGLGWTPCIGPTLAAVLTLATSSAGAGRGALLSLAYSFGLGIPFLVAAMSMDRALRSFGWARRHAGLVMRGGGAFLVVIGVLQVSGIWARLIAQLQGVVVNWQVPF